MDDKQTEKAIAQTEVVLAALREPAIKLLQDGVASAYTSTAHRTDKGLQVNTVKEGSHVPSMMLVEGSTESGRRIMNLDDHLKGEYKITHSEGKKSWQEKDTFELSGGLWDGWMGRSDKFNVSLTRKDANGRVMESYLPAISEEQKQLDPNGQPLRLARLAGSDANASLENIANPGNKRQEANYIIKNGNSELSYNETREKYPAAWAYRSVVRDMNGKVLGIVNQTFTLDDSGDLSSVQTSARKPMQVKH